MNVQALKSLLWPALCGLLIAIIILLLYPNQFGLSHRAASGNGTSPPASYAEAVQRATPSVVNIYTTKIVHQRNHPMFDDPLLRHFFNRGNDQQQNRLQRSLGSGVIVDSRGYILTNHHIIAGADQILISLFDRRETLAQVVGTDPDTDLAVLKIELKDIEAIRFGSAASARVGDVVLAIGNPFGFGQTVTQGIISATGRYGLNLNTYENYLQTDADINPGNSGGALVSVDGELLGINSAIFSRSGGSQGIGLAIPVENASEVLASIIKFGKVIRGWLGIEVNELNRLLAEQLNLSVTQGVIVTGTYTGGPANLAGLLPGDVITHIDGKEVVDGRAGMMRVSRLVPGEPTSISLLRDGRRLEVEVIIGTRPPPEI